MWTMTIVPQVGHRAGYDNASGSVGYPSIAGELLP
jgi:hypothetical protein